MDGGDMLMTYFFSISPEMSLLAYTFNYVHLAGTRNL